MYLTFDKRKEDSQKKKDYHNLFHRSQTTWKTLCENRAVSGQSVSTPPSSLSRISGIPNFSWPKETFGAWFWAVSLRLE